MHVEKGDVVLSFLLNIRGRWQVNYRIFSSLCFIPYGLDQIQRGFQSDKMNFIPVAISLPFDHRISPIVIKLCLEDYNYFGV